MMKITTQLEKNLAGMAIAFLIVSVVPLLFLSSYIYPASDDYVFGAQTYTTWIQTHSFWETLKAAVQVARDMYFTWQGTYSACFLMALQPGVFEAYWLTPFILLLSLIGSHYCLFYLVLRKRWKVETSVFLIISTTAVLMNVQFVDSPRDAFYWYNGAVYYTFYYSVGLFFACSLIQTITTGRWQRYGWGILSVLLSLFLAGGNFVSGFALPFILVTVMMMYKMNGKRVPFILYLVLVTFCLGMLVSVLAPGNAVRQATVTTNKTVVSAFVKILGEGFCMLAKMLSLTKCFLFLFLSPFIYKAVRHIHYHFSRPGLFLLVTYLLYSLFLFPTNYALGIDGDSRTVNVYAYNSTWFVLINLAYFMGYLQTHRNLFTSDILKLARDIKQELTARKHTMFGLYAFVLLLFSVTILQKPSASRQVSDYITSGQAGKFRKAMQQREQAYKSSREHLVFTTALPPKVDAFYVSDLAADANFWINQGVCLYYGKRSVIQRTPRTIADFYSRGHCYKKEVGPGNLRYKEVHVEYMSQR